METDAPVDAAELAERWVARGFRERMASQQWALLIQREVDGTEEDLRPTRNAVSAALSDCLLQQACVGDGASSKMMSFLVEGLGCQLIQTRDFIDSFGRKLGVANAIRPLAYAAVLDVIRKVLPEITGKAQSSFVQQTATRIVVTVASAVTALLDGHLSSSSSAPTGSLTGTAMWRSPATARTEEVQRDNVRLSLELVEDILRDNRVRLLVRLTQQDGFDWSGVVARWEKVKAARSAPGPDSGAQVEHTRSKQDNIHSKIEYFLRDCQPRDPEQQTSIFQHPQRNVHRKKDSVSTLQLLAALEYGAMHAPAIAEAAAWEVAVASDGATLEDALHQLWFVTLVAAEKATPVEAVRSACFAFIRAPTLIKAVVDRNGLAWSPEHGERALKRLLSHRAAVAAAEKTWGCSVEGECRGALGRSGLLGNVMAPQSGLPLLSTVEVTRTLKEVFAITDDRACDAIDPDSTLRLLQEFLGGGKLEWHVGSIIACRGISELRQSIQDLATRSFKCEATRARVETGLACSVLDDWVCAVFLSLPIVPAVGEHDDEGGKLADAILRAVLCPAANGAVSSEDTPADTFDEQSLFQALEASNACTLKTAGQVIGIQLLLAEIAAYSRVGIGTIALRLLRAAPGLYARAITWISEHVDASTPYGPLLQGSDGAKAFDALCHALNPALITHNSSGPDGRGCKLAAATALEASNQVLAKHSAAVDPALPALADYATKCGRRSRAPTPREAAALLIPKDSLDLVIHATTSGTGSVLDLRNSGRGPLNTAWVVDHLARAIPIRPDPAAAHGLADVAFAFAVHSAPARMLIVQRLFSETMARACLEIGNETHGHALAEFIVRVLAVVRGDNETTYELAVQNVLQLCLELLLQPNTAPVSFVVRFATTASVLGPQGLVRGLSEDVALLATEVAHGLRLVGAEAWAGPFFDLTSSKGRQNFSDLLALPPVCP